MEFNIATGFDRTKQDEIFTKVRLDMASMEAVVQDKLNRMTYEQRDAWIAKLVAEGHATIGG